jgi:hypothetical protein
MLMIVVFAINEAEWCSTRPGVVGSNTGCVKGYEVRLFLHCLDSEDCPILNTVTCAIDGNLASIILKIFSASPIDAA